jgi:hypothetical protein
MWQGSTTPYRGTSLPSPYHDFFQSSPTPELSSEITASGCGGREWGMGGGWLTSPRGHTLQRSWITGTSAPRTLYPSTTHRNSGGALTGCYEPFQAPVYLFIYLFTTLLVAPTIWARTEKWKMVLPRACREVTVAYFKVPSKHLPVGTEENHEIPHSG